MPYASINPNFLQSEEEEDELVKDKLVKFLEATQNSSGHGKKKVPDEWFWLGKPCLLQHLKELRNLSAATNCHCESI